MAGVERAQHIGAASFCELAFIGGNLLTSFDPANDPKEEGMGASGPMSMRTLQVAYETVSGWHKTS
jgi:hypothetical protein